MGGRNAVSDLVKIFLRVLVVLVTTEISTVPDKFIN